MLLSILPVLLRLRRSAKGTTLLGAGNWSVFAWGCWEIAWTAAWFSPPASVLDQLWYAAAIVSLCPPIAVLGAKRPGSRVWTAFVVLPLVLVFAWPALVSWVHQVPPQRFQLEWPMFAGYLLVLVMGYGNYLGTRSSLPGLLTALALGWLAWQLASPLEAEQSLHPLGPTGLLAASSAIFLLLPSKVSTELTSWNRVWWEFQEAFGIVWAKRVMERLNHAAQQESWPAHWDQAGLIWEPDVSDAKKEETLKRVDHTMRWLLRRFVDPEWINKRL